MNLKKLLIALIFIAVTIVLFFSLRYCKKQFEYQATADFEPIETVYLVWSEKDSFVVSDIAAKISPYESVTIFTLNNELEKARIQKMVESKGGNMANITLSHLNNIPASTWIRDFYPLFLKDKKNEKVKLVKLQYWNKTLDINEFVSHADIPFIENSSLYSLGGTREFNGKGTGIFVQSHEKIANPEFNTDRKEFEKKLKKQFQLKKIIWLNKGIPQDELISYGKIDENIYPLGSNNHIDEFCRFIDSDKIMISFLTDSETRNNPILLEAKKRLDENYWILKNAKDQDGKYFEIIKMPFAPLIIRPMEDKPNNTVFRTDVTSYMNFLITNNTIILPSYKHLDPSPDTGKKEEYIQKTFQKYFPDKQVVFINIGSLNSRGGGIHCITASKPALKKPKSGNFKLRFKKKRKV